MKTKIIKINPKKPEISKIRIMAEILKQGGLVAFPTETVYGLGADALNVNAVKKIFQAKARPSDNPLIVHIANKKDVYKLTKNISKKAEKLMNKFWPGPLTLILKKSQIVPKIVTNNLNAVAIRMPANKIALSLIKQAGTPIAAPSANLSSKPSPTSSQHVKQDLDGKINAIIDGGKTKIGVESTIVDLTENIPILLRPGAVTLEQLKNVLKQIKIHPMAEGVKIKTAKKFITKSPGMKYKHYAPNADVILVEGEEQNIEKKIQEFIVKYSKSKKIGIITNNKNNHYKTGIIKFVYIKPTTLAKNLFSIFRKFDAKKIDIIFVQGISNAGLGFAVMNRLRKAASKIIKI